MKIFNDLSRPYSLFTWGEVIVIVIAALIPTLFFVLLLLGILIPKAHAHDSWISQQALKNTAGEWCCGDHDCKSYTKAASSAKGWVINGELVPYDEALPVVPPDGMLTICRRPDGTRRCVFGLKPEF